MAARSTTPTAPTKDEPETATFVVLTDLVNLVVGKKPNGSPEVTRLRLGDRITAPVNHPEILELGAALAREDRLDEDYKAIRALGNAKVETLQLRSKTGLKHHRITADGVRKRMGAEDDPVAKAAADALPVDAALPDVAPLDA